MEIKNRKIISNIAVFLGFIIIASGHIFSELLINLDEVWIYNFARCLQDGLLPYKDVSMVITPLFPIICAVFLKIFGNEMLVLRFFECFEIAAVLFIMYKILNRLKINKWVALSFVIRNILFLFMDWGMGF